MGFADHFSIANIPYGIASSSQHPRPFPVTRLQDNVFFLNDLGLDCGPELKQAFLEVSLLSAPGLRQIFTLCPVN